MKIYLIVFVDENTIKAKITPFTYKDTAIEFAKNLIKKHRFPKYKIDYLLKFGSILSDKGFGSSMVIQWQEIDIDVPATPKEAFRQDILKDYLKIKTPISTELVENILGFEFKFKKLGKSLWGYEGLDAKKHKWYFITKNGSKYVSNPILICDFYEIEVDNIEAIKPCIENFKESL